MAGKRTRRTFTPEEKARIVLLAAKAGVPRSTWNEWKRRRGQETRTGRQSLMKNRCTPEEE